MCLINRSFKLISEYATDPSSFKPKWYYGSKVMMKFKRPQMLMEEGKPAWLYVASGCNIYGGESTASYVLKYREI